MRAREGDELVPGAKGAKYARAGGGAESLAALTAITDLYPTPGKNPPLKNNQTKTSEAALSGAHLVPI